MHPRTWLTFPVPNVLSLATHRVLISLTVYGVVKLLYTLFSFLLFGCVWVVFSDTFYPTYCCYCLKYSISLFDYSHVDDIDLFTGAMTETHLPNSSVGPTFACLIGKQFRKLIIGDRYWHETPDRTIRFSNGKYS